MWYGVVRYASVCRSLLRVTGLFGMSIGSFLGVTGLFCRALLDCIPQLRRERAVAGRALVHSQRSRGLYVCVCVREREPQILSERASRAGTQPALARAGDDGEPQ